MGNNHSNKLNKSHTTTESVQVNADELSDSFELKSIPNNDVFIGAFEESMSDCMSNRNSSEQALKICHENPNCVTDLSRKVDQQALILRKEYRDAILCNITNITNETSEIHLDSDYLYL